MKKRPSAATAYATFVAGLKARIQGARLSAARAVNRDLILLYWDIGQAIVERQKAHGWGDSVVEKLSRDLRKSFPGMSGFSTCNLRDMKRLHTTYADMCSDPEILRQLVAESGGKQPKAIDGQLLSGLKVKRRFLRQLVAEIPWGHHRFLLDKVSDASALVYYLLATARFGWSRNVLLNQIKAGAYERSRLEKKSHNFPAALPEHLAEQAEEALKSSYNLEFLGIRKALKERDGKGEPQGGDSCQPGATPQETHSACFRALKGRPNLQPSVGGTCVPPLSWQVRGFQLGRTGQTFLAGRQKPHARRVCSPILYPT